MQNKKLLGNILLLITAAIWGSAFVAQRMVAGTELGSIAFCACRYGLAALATLPIIPFSQKRLGRKGRGVFDLRAYSSKDDTPVETLKHRRKATIRAGILAGIFMFCGTVFQQIGLETVTAGKAGFLTALYVMLVPIGALIVFKKKPGPLAWVGAALGVAGLYFLSFAGGSLGAAQKGDLIVLLGACGWAGQILTIDHYMEKGADGIILAELEYAVTAILSLLLIPFFEHPTWSAVLGCWWPIVYTAIFSTVIGFTFQIIGQKYTAPTAAALIMCLESVFAALSGAIFLHEQMQGTELLGSCILFAGVVISQLTLPGKKNG